MASGGPASSSSALGDDDYPMDGGLWALGGPDDCDCAGPPPPEFMLPPPPRPPSLQPDFCGSGGGEDGGVLPMETCDALPLIDPSYRSSPSFQTSAVIGLCSVLLGLAIFIGVILVWKHKRKVQNFLPCKTSPANTREGGTSTGVIYEDLHEGVSRQTPTHHHHHHHAGGGHIVAPSIEMIDVKNNIHYPSGYPISTHPPVFLCSSPGPDPYCSHQDLYNPVYEELSDPEDDNSDLGGRQQQRQRRPPRISRVPSHSEDEFAEDELSLGGGRDEGECERRLRGGDDVIGPSGRQYGCYRTMDGVVGGSGGGGPTRMGRFRRPHEPLPPIPCAGTNNNKRHRSLERCRQEFHEGMLLDALLQLYPRVGSVGPSGRRQHNNHHNNTNHHHHQAQIPSIAQRLQPYETVPVIGHLATFRPMVPHGTTNGQNNNKCNNKPYSQDSAFGSDSGYSNHTSGTRGSSGRGRNGRDPRRLSQLSADLNLT